jgi:hypothetical protein
MIRNYNGNVNRAILRDLKKLCDVNAENERNLFEAFNKKGEVSCYEDLDPFIKQPDEMSTIVTMKNEAEIKEYLKKDFSGRVDMYLNHKNPEEDYLLTALVKFIKENGKFPKKDTMKQLEKDAETKRITELPSNTSTAPQKITKQDIAREILELSEEIIETRRETKPKDIIIHVEPYDDELYISDNDFDLVINWDRYYDHGNSGDYSCAVTLKNDTDIDRIRFQYYYNDTIHIEVEGWHTTGSDIPINTLISIHKFIVETAKAEGIEFISEIDYDKIQIA